MTTKKRISKKKRRRMRMIRWGISIVVLAVVLVALVWIIKKKDAAQRNEAPPQVTTEPVVSVVPETEPETQEKEPEIIDITIHAVGDCTLGSHQKQGYEGSFHEMYDKQGPDYFFQNVKGVFEGDDFTIANCEVVLSNSKETMRTTKEWNLLGRPEYASLFKNASIEAVSLANNHIMDYNEKGAQDTKDNLTAAGVEYAISSQWGDRYGMYTTAKGIKIGFVSVNEYYEEKATYKFLEEGYNQLREQGANLMIACTHWGGDGVHELEQDQIDMGHWCIDKGYDVVVGCHPHVIQGLECYNGKYIVYSMGNFCYGGHRNPADKSSMIYEQTFRFVDGVLQTDTNAKVYPCSLSSRTDKNDFCPRILTGEEGQKVIGELNSYSKQFNLHINEDGTIAK